MTSDILILGAGIEAYNRHAHGMVPSPRREEGQGEGKRLMLNAPIHLPPHPKSRSDFCLSPKGRGEIPGNRVNIKK